ncbi:hypothetical protein SAMN04488556_4139 [Halostagnicola kamekurae]|uniref:Uncharacterized protein n=1 Tax=Halostagnicola kamekurae TaxID=619731 RepID=A0A1I6UWA0_9EURY|nr:hypothetical protein SAMN04488556_4139 [Halostagnicola kamekurae]
MGSDSSLHIEDGGCVPASLLKPPAKSLIVELLQLGVDDGLK